MTKFDKLLLALTAAGIWALVIQNAVQPSGAEDQLSRWEIERIIESCDVTGHVSDDYLYLSDIDC